MPYASAADGTPIFYKDWGKGPPILFSHGWPLSADAWEGQLIHFAQQGFRVIAHDRRGHGRSGQPGGRDSMDIYADDLAALMDALDLQGIVLVGHSTGGGEVARYLGRHGTGRVAKVVFCSSIVPRMMQADDNPDGATAEAIEGLRTGLLADRAQLYRDVADGPFFGANRPGAKVSEGMRDDFWRQSMMGSVLSHFHTSFTWAEDYRPDLRKIDRPVLVIQGDDDQIVPFKATGARVREIIPDARLIIYEGAPHAVPLTHAVRFNADLLAFASG